MPEGSKRSKAAKIMAKRSCFVRLFGVGQGGCRPNFPGNSDSPVSPDRGQAVPPELHQPWVVIGAGGHGREVAHVLLAMGQRVIGFLDDDPEKQGLTYGNLKVLGTLACLEHVSRRPCIAMGIGSSLGRRATVARIKAMPGQWRFPPIIHPAAIIGERVAVEEGALIQAGCLLTCDVQVGAFAVLNVGVSLSHDTCVGEFATLAPGARLAGAVTVGECAEIGMGTQIIQLKNLGAHCRTGAGAVVIRDVPPGTTVVGVPARPMEKGLPLKGDRIDALEHLKTPNDSEPAHPATPLPLTQKAG